ncbi:MAG: twin-arginine translocation signal domain-containing protein, partial [candidate division KSB1 bacterium]
MRNHTSLSQPSANISRRKFIGSTAAAVSAMSLGASLSNSEAKTQNATKAQFKLKYAPHFGMFEAHAGKDVVAQLQFMAEGGFTALEDNGMMSRP